MSYQLLDSGEFEKLEQIGPYRLIRPAPGAVWKRSDPSAWKKYDARFVRFESGKGEWDKKASDLPKEWSIEVDELKFLIRPTSFGHLGIFPEQASNWRKLREWVKTQSSKSKEIKILNVFAYTGGSTFACLQGGATQVVHVDASKATVDWASKNAKALRFDDRIRWMVDDASAFVAREQKRGNQYQGVILDPPSFGRGAKNQVWKIEDHLIELLEGIKPLLANAPNFVLLSSHTPGYTPISLSNLLKSTFSLPTARFDAGEMSIEEAGGRLLPSGASCFYFSE